MTSENPTPLMAQRALPNPSTGSRKCFVRKSMGVDVENVSAETFGDGEEWTWDARDELFLEHVESRLGSLRGDTVEELIAAFWKNERPGFRLDMREDGAMILIPVAYARDMELARVVVEAVAKETIESRKPEPFDPAWYEALESIASSD
jgi:hypothetical protein